MRHLKLIAILSLLGCQQGNGWPTGRNPDYSLHGLRFHELAATAPSRAEIESQVEFTFTAWRAALRQHRVICEPSRLSADVLLLNRVHFGLDEFLGLAHVNDGNISLLEVQVREGRIVTTSCGRSALAHELGHLIENQCTGQTSNYSLLGWHKYHGVPY